jgi:UDP-glucose 4-epimerase
MSCASSIGDSCLELSSPSSSSSVSTPDTEKSLLLDDPTNPFLHGVAQHDGYILVVGGLGYIGSHTTWELVKQGYNVIIIDNLSNSFRNVLDRLQSLMAEHFKTSEHRPSIEFHEGDYRDQPTMKIILSQYTRSSKYSLESDNWESEVENLHQSSITGVIHFAAHKAVKESIQQPLKYYSNNVGGLIDFCSLLNDFRIKTLIFSSSATVYGELANKGGRIPEEYCTHETTAYIDTAGQERTTQGGCTGISNPYGRTKWMCEAILNGLAAADPEWTIFALRYFNPIGCDPSGQLGEDPRAPPSNLMAVVAKAMTAELPVVTIYGTDWETADGTAIRDYIHVSDLARGHLAALAGASSMSEFPFRGGGGFHAFNLGSGRGHSVLEVVAAMEAASGKRIVARGMERRAGDVAVCVAEPSRAEAQLGRRTEKSLQSCCEDVCRFLGIGEAKIGLAV